MVFPAQQKALVQGRQLLLRKTAGVQRQGQQPIGNGEPYAGGGGLDTPTLQPVTEVDLTILPETVSVAGQKVIGFLLPGEGEAAALPLEISLGQ